MGNGFLQILVLAGIAIFLILKLRAVLGTREGFEKPALPADDTRSQKKPTFEVIEGGPDRDIVDHVPEGSPQHKALGAMKVVEPSFNVGEFLKGARGAYEMILIAFERGEIDKIRPFLAQEIEDTFEEAINERLRQGLTVEATFGGVRELTLQDADFDRNSRTAEITVRFVGELTSVVRNKAGEIVQGSSNDIKRQRDVWTFARRMGVDDPNWQLVATGD